MLSKELDFAIKFARKAGQTMVDMRPYAVAESKGDGTPVTDIDRQINRDFIRAVLTNFGFEPAVIGEEDSSRRPSRVTWVIDPIDGTKEYVNRSIPDHLRTSCVGIALFKDGVLWLSVVFNPFRNELFVASLHTGRATLNGRSLRTLDRLFSKTLPYDYRYFDSGVIDARCFDKVMSNEPRGVYSAIYQACEVADGRSAFAVFPGKTIHDIAPGALLVKLAGGLVCDVNRRELQWHDLRGAVYAASPEVLKQVLTHLHK